MGTGAEEAGGGGGGAGPAWRAAVTVVAMGEEQKDKQVEAKEEVAVKWCWRRNSSHSNRSRRLRSPLGRCSSSGRGFGQVHYFSVFVYDV